MWQSVTLWSRKPASQSISHLILLLETTRWTLLTWLDLLCNLIEEINKELEAISLLDLTHTAGEDSTVPAWLGQSFQNLEEIDAQFKVLSDMTDNKIRQTSIVFPYFRKIPTVNNANRD